MPLISLCMIVKNEAKVLGRCLDSISDLIDEIIVVDTGSIDETKRVVAAYEAKIYDFSWQDDFAAARNYAVSQAVGTIGCGWTQTMSSIRKAMTSCGRSLQIQVWTLCFCRIICSLTRLAHRK